MITFEEYRQNKPPLYHELLEVISEAYDNDERILACASLLVAAIMLADGPANRQIMVREAIQHVLDGVLYYEAEFKKKGMP